MYCGHNGISHSFDDGLDSDAESDWLENEDISASEEENDGDNCEEVSHFEHACSQPGHLIWANRTKSEAEQGLDIAQFLDALSWGDEDCIVDPEVRGARTALFTSEDFPKILRRWWRPPGRRAHSARKVLQNVATECVSDCIKNEMKQVTPLLRSPEEPLSRSALTSLDLESLTEQLQTENGAPVLWTVLEKAGWSERQAERNTHKTPRNIILIVIAMLAYTRSHHSNRLQTLYAIYLKTCGLSARAFDVLHSLGLVMSHKWTANAMKDISEVAITEVQESIRYRAWFWSYDNVNIPMRVFSMRTDRENKFYSATACTVYVLPKNVKVSENINSKYQQGRREGMKDVFDIKDIVRNTTTNKHLATQAKYQILRCLLGSPTFAVYKWRGVKELQPPPPIDLLPCGKEHVIQQFILKTADIDESSYEGNENVIKEWLKQLRLDSPDQTKQTALSRLIFSAGDQLTTDRTRGIQKYRHADVNAYERLDFLVPTFGWFHLLIAFATSLHKQYMGTSAGTGLQRAFDILNRKGLNTPHVEGIFWKSLDEAIAHICEAHILACWLQVTGEKDLRALLSKTPQELLQYAEHIHRDVASRRALHNMTTQSELARDQVREQATMFVTDALVYLDLREAIKIGDVGRIENLIPSLLFRFAGGGSTKYTGEMLELIQGMQREWSPEVRNFIRNHCWLVNSAGQRDSFVAVDQAQEHNVKDIKVTYRSIGPGATLDYLSKLSPGIPVFRAIREHMKWQHQSILVRGTRHNDVDKSKDVEKYMRIIVSEGWFEEKKGRTLKSVKDRVTDFVTNGTIAVTQGKTIDRWWQTRNFTRRTGNIWDDNEMWLMDEMWDGMDTG
ncbi:hypothetical protein BC826DRAFT_1093531 [Russula brevipes]|nr:hypothetical protein BC826DRAFT_1093531 [Russula brevipes]